MLKPVSASPIQILRWAFWWNSTEDSPETISEPRIAFAIPPPGSPTGAGIRVSLSKLRISTRGGKITLRVRANVSAGKARLRVEGYSGKKWRLVKVVPLPGSATVTLRFRDRGYLGVRVLLRMEPLRKSPHRAAVVKLLSAFPDMSVLVAGTQLPGPEALANLLIDQTQVLLIATADPRDITATVFYALQVPKADVLGKLAGQKGPSWDKRQLQALGPQLLTFARPDLLGPGPSFPTGAPPSSDAPPAPSVTTEQWQQRLRDKLLVAGPPLNAEILTMNERVRLGGGLPTPRALRIGISGEDSPSVHVRCELATPADAAKLMAVLPEMKEKLQSRLFWLGLGGLLSQLQLSQQGSAVVLTGKVPGTDADILLQYLAQLLPPPPPGLGLPPAAPTPAVAPSAGGAPSP